MQHSLAFAPPIVRAAPRGAAPIRAAAIFGLLLITMSVGAAAQGRPATASGQARDTVSLTRAEVRSRALRANPELAAARVDTAVARGELQQASTLLRFNPSVEVLGRGGSAGVEPSVAQEVEIFGQRGTRMASGRAGVDRARFGVADATRRTLGDVDRAFYRLFSAVRRATLEEEVLALNQRLANVAARQLAEGEISRLDYNLVVVELGRSRASALATRREREQVALELGRLLGLPPDTTVVPVMNGVAGLQSSDTAAAASPARGALSDGPSAGALSADPATPSLDIDSLVAVALARRPDLEERAAAARQANADASTARREALPNLVFRVTWEREAGSERTVRPGVGLSVPLFNLNGGAVEANRARARRARLERAALVRRVRADVASAAAGYESAAAEAEVLASTVLAPARQNRQLLETAYREGKVGLPVLLLIRNQVIDAELAYWDAWLAEHEATATLDEVTGRNLDPAGASPLGGIR